MAARSVHIEISIETLRAAISSLSAKDKRAVMAMLDEQLMEDTGDAEEETAVAEAQAQLDAGEYVTLDDFIAGKRTP
jgi:hypothetical protein